MKYGTIKDGQLISLATERNSIAIPGVPRPSMWTDEQLATRGVYPLVFADLPEGHVARQSAWSIEGGAAYQTVLELSSPESRAAELQAHRAREIAAFIDAYSVRIVYLSQSLAKLGLEIPCTEADVEAKVVEVGIANIPDGVIGDIAAARALCNSVMSDDDIAAAWSYIKEHV